MILDREIMACSLLKLAKYLKIEFAKTHFIQIISKINIYFEIKRILQNTWYSFLVLNL